MHIRKHITLSTLTIMTLSLLSLGCGAGTQEKNPKDKAYGASYHGKASTTSQHLQVPLQATSKSGIMIDNGRLTLHNITTKSGADCSKSAPCAVKVTRDCYKETRGTNRVTGYDNASVRCGAFMNLEHHISKGYVVPDGKVLRFSGVLDIQDTHNNLESAQTLKVTFKVPPCATDKDGKRWYINNDDLTEGVLDTQTLLILISTPIRACEVAQNQRWISTTITNPFDPNLREAVLEANDVSLDKGVRLTLFALQKDADVVEGQSSTPAVQPPLEQPEDENSSSQLPPVVEPNSPIKILETTLNQAFEAERKKINEEYDPVGGAVKKVLKLFYKLDDDLYVVKYHRSNGNGAAEIFGIYDVSKKAFVKELTYYRNDPGVRYGERVKNLSLKNDILSYKVALKIVGKSITDNRAYNIKTATFLPLTRASLDILVKSYLYDPSKRNKEAIENANVSEITDMSGLFDTRSAIIHSLRKNTFDGDISHWDTSKVTDMRYMFYNAVKFNHDISTWDTSKVTNMRGMFTNAKSFNQDIGKWDVSKVTNMDNMFSGCFVFNQNIGDWDVSNVTDMSSMFAYTHIFSQDIGRWNVSSVTQMDWMFSNAKIFNQDISHWDVSKVTDMRGMFLGTQKFNQNIGAWDVSRVTDMHEMFEGAESFDQNIGGWDVSSITNMSYMFSFAKSFNQDIGAWNVSKVTSMRSMFSNAHSFNQDISIWDVSKVVHWMGFHHAGSNLQTTHIPVKFR